MIDTHDKQGKLLGVFGGIYNGIRDKKSGQSAACVDAVDAVVFVVIFVETVSTYSDIIFGVPINAVFSCTVPSMPIIRLPEICLCKFKLIFFFASR